MIIKFVRYDDEINYTLFDKIDYFSISKKFAYETFAPGGRFTDALKNVIWDGFDRIHYFFDIEDGIVKDPSILDKQERMGEKYNYLVIEMVKSDNKKIMVFFDGIAYICDDNGKTIETIKANPINND